jgi:hypothetical protein
VIYLARKVEVDTTEDREGGILNKIGPWSFILGLVIAVIAALTGNVFWIMGVLGLVVGLLNVADREIKLYLLASLTFLVSANALSTTLMQMVGIIPVIGEWMNFINPLLANIALFVAPGAGVVALKALYDITRY